MLICTVVGARPNFMKIAPILHALRRRELPYFLVHTGQHYDANMSQVFFDELRMPKPDVYLGIGSDSHARQTARVMIAFEEIALERKPDLVIVAGDVNSTLACALVAAKLNIPVAHVEAGLRSFDREMPEEVNRILTDHLSDFLFTTEPSGNQHLHAEGIAAEKIHHVGNCMVDSLLAHLPAALTRTPWMAQGLTPHEYALLTLHRPSNVDDRATLTQMLTTIAGAVTPLPILFPVHPRTQTRLAEWGLAAPPALRLVEPLPYLTFLGLMAKARVVLTDSGGVQEETTALGIPCITLRWNTERPITVTEGTNVLVGTEPQAIMENLQRILSGNTKSGVRPKLWDGAAAERVVDVIAAWAKTRTP